LLTFGDEEGMRTGIPRYSKAWSILAALGFLVFMIQTRFGPQDKQWLAVSGGLCLAAAMTVVVAGMIAERKQADENKSPEHSPA